MQKKWDVLNAERGRLGSGNFKLAARQNPNIYYNSEPNVVAITIYMTNPNYIILRQNQFKSDPHYFLFSLSSILKLRTFLDPFGIVYIILLHTYVIALKSEEIVFSDCIYLLSLGGWGKHSSFGRLHGKMNYQRSKVDEKPKLNLFPKIEEPWEMFMTKDEE